MLDGKLAFAYNIMGIQTDFTRSDVVLTAGEHELRAHFAYDGGGLGKGGAVTLYDGDTVVAEGRVERTLPYFFSMDETVDVGADVASPVSSDYGAVGNEFTGRIAWVRIDAGDDSHDHLMDPDHQLNIAMTRQ
jgi:arylsulfatase